MNKESCQTPSDKKSLEQEKVRREIMKTPEIVVQNEKGAQLLSLILKAQKPEWGETETPLAKETTEYFNEHPLDSDTIDALSELRKKGIDDEALYYLAFTYEHPERKELLLKLMPKYKPNLKNPQEIIEKVLSILRSIDKSFSKSPLAEKFNAEMETDKDKRLEKIEETEERIKSLIDFFKPDPKTTNVKRLSVAPTNPLYKTNSGRNFSAFPGEQIIISHIDNVENQDHEFSHGLINPIIDKLSHQLTDEQKQKIVSLSSGSLKRESGESYDTLLREEFVRTYNEVIKKGERLQTYTDFKNEISNISEEQFQTSRRFKEKCEEIGIKNSEDFKNKSQEYFEKFEKNQLREIAFGLYQEYSKVKDEPDINFELFILNNFIKQLNINMNPETNNINGVNKKEEISKSTENRSDKQSIEEINIELGEAIKKRNEVLALRMKGEVSGIDVDREDKKIDTLLNELRTITQELAIRKGESLKNENKEGIENAEKEATEEKEIIDNEAENTPNYSEEAEKSYMSKIIGENSFHDLLRRVSENGDLIAKDGYVYKRENIMDAINKVAVEGESALNYITRTAGLRDKVKEILEKQKFNDSEKGRLQKELRDEFGKKALRDLKNNPTS